MQLFSTGTSKQRFANRECSVASFLPYKYFWNDKTLYLKDSSFMQVVKLGGFSFETADDEDVDVRKNIRNMLIKGLAGRRTSFYFHLVRRVENPNEGYNQTLMPDYFSASLNALWTSKHKVRKTFVNDIYISIIKSQSREGVTSFVENLIDKFNQKADKSAWSKVLKSSYEEIEEVSARFVNTLRDYKPKLLGVKKTKDGTFSEILEFLGSIVNVGISSPMSVSTIDLSHYISTQRLYFGSGAIEVKSDEGSKFAGIVSIKEYSPATAPNAFDGLLQMPFELIISQSFSFIEKAVALQTMRIQQGRMIAAADAAVSQINEINDALDDAMSGRIAFGRHHMTVLCIESTMKTLENALSMAATEVGNSGIIPVRERVNMEPVFWGQFPGNFDYNIRAARVNSLNLASFASFHNYPIGKKDDNHWGEAVTVLDTTSGTPFYFNFHVKDVGHTTIIGPTGAGKTVLMNFLCSQARKFKCKMFFFDKDRGAEIFIRALGGKYTIINPAKNCGFNPLQLDDTQENRNFIAEWIANLVTVNGGVISPEEFQIIEDAVKGNYRLDKKDRVLTNIVPFLGVSSAGSLASRIAMWHGQGSYARVFDNEEDLMRFDDNLVYGYEMGHLLQDKKALNPVLLYLFQRINNCLDGSPAMIVLDEAWALIDNEVFAPKIKDWLKVLRKLNCFVVFATQSVEDTSESKISGTLIQQTATQIFLPNLKATEVYKTHFMLSQREFILIKTTDPGSRFFLIKQGIDAVVAKVDLNNMDDIISVLSGRAESVAVLDEVIDEIGEDPKKWLPVFYERVKLVE